MTLPEPLQPLARDPARSALLLDFDGTLAEIVARPELARPVEGAADVVRATTGVFGLVSVISGRPTDDVRALLGVDGVRYLGLYGLEDAAPVPPAVLAAARAAAERVEGARVEEKGGSVAIHYRQSDEREAARARVLAALAEVPEGFEAIEGKMVVELVPAGRPRKGGAVRRLLEQERPTAVLYAGDDLADLEAFAELDRGARNGVHVVRVAVAGPETPEALTGHADLSVDGPRGLVRLLQDLVAAAER